MSKSIKPGLKRAVSIIENHLESVKKDSPEAASGMMFSQIIIMNELDYLNEENKKQKKQI